MPSGFNRHWLLLSWLKDWACLDEGWGGFDCDDSTILTITGGLSTNFNMEFDAVYIVLGGAARGVYSSESDLSYCCQRWNGSARSSQAVFLLQRTRHRGLCEIASIFREREACLLWCPTLVLRGRSSFEDRERLRYSNRWTNPIWGPPGYQRLCWAEQARIKPYLEPWLRREQPNWVRRWLASFQWLEVGIHSFAVCVQAVEEDDDKSVLGRAPCHWMISLTKTCNLSLKLPSLWAVSKWWSFHICRSIEIYATTVSKMFPKSYTTLDRLW